METPIAEVIESATSQLVGEVYRDTPAPAFGSWVRVTSDDGIELYAVVSSVEIGSIEPGRRATAFGRNTDELRREMPHVLELLRTSFGAQVLAYRAPGEPIQQTLPPCPAPIHSFIYSCVDDQVCALADPFDYLRTLARNTNPGVPVDDLLVAVLQRLYRASGGPLGGRPVLVRAARSLSRLIHDDHERLQSILRRVA